MKSKKILSLASCFLATTLFASCAGLTSIVTFNDYWQSNPDANLTSFTETLEYDVTYSGDKGLTDGYTLSYNNGKYVTTLSLVTEGVKTYYSYETEFSIQAVYTYGEEVKTFDDKITTLVTFEKSANHLQPITSHKEMQSHSPVNTTTPTKMEDCYSLAHYSIDTTYESDLSKGKTVVTNLELEENATQEFSFEINDEKARYLDNEQLYLAMRAVNPTSNPTPKMLVYSPFTVAVQGVNASFSTAEGETLTFNRNGVPVNETVEWYTVTLSLDSNNPGSSQMLWIAKRTENSKTRNVIFKMQLPLSYAMGEFNFTLTSETFVEN